MPKQFDVYYYWMQQQYSRIQKYIPLMYLFFICHSIEQGVVFFCFFGLNNLDMKSKERRKKKENG